MAGWLLAMTLTGIACCTASRVEYRPLHRRADDRGKVDLDSVITLNSTHDYYTLATFTAPPDPVYQYATPTESWTKVNSLYSVVQWLTLRQVSALRRTYVSQTLSFSFPFYGQKYRDIKIAVGGTMKHGT